MSQTENPKDSTSEPRYHGICYPHGKFEGTRCPKHPECVTIFVTQVGNDEDEAASPQWPKCATDPQPYKPPQPAPESNKIIGNIIDRWDMLANDTKHYLKDTESAFCNALDSLRLLQEQPAPVDGMIERVTADCEATIQTLPEWKRPESARGKLPIDRPCSACSGGDSEMLYHDHEAPFRTMQPAPSPANYEYLPTPDPAYTIGRAPSGPTAQSATPSPRKWTPSEQAKWELCRHDVLKTGCPYCQLEPAQPAPEITVIKLQSEYPRDFVCYECKDGRHAHCVGVPCNCKCPAQPAPEPAVSSTGKELVWMDESHGRWAVFVGNVFCGYAPSEERAKDKVAALLEAIQESHDHQ